MKNIKRRVNKTSKRALYESIMKNVSKIVKRHLNEYIDTDSYNDVLDDELLQQIYDYETEIIDFVVQDNAIEWVYDDFIFDISDDMIILPAEGIDDWYDFCINYLESEWDELDYDTQYAIARQANKSVNDYFDGNTEASYEDYE